MRDVRERTKTEEARGMAWMWVSLLIAAAIITAFMTVTQWLGASYELGLAIAALVSMDALVFRWGVRRFDIMPPKYFLDAADSREE